MIETKKRKRILRSPPRAVYVALCIFPVVLTALFYALRPFTGVMDWVSLHIAAPVRTFLGIVTSIFPFSVMEVLFTVAGIWLIYYIVKTIKLTIRERGARIKTLSKRLIFIAVLAFYVWGSFCWLWNSGYFARSFAERNNIVPQGANAAELIELTQMFARRANELAPLMTRDEDDRFNEDRREMFAVSTEIFDGIAAEFPELGGRVFRPKPMYMYSWLMSRTGYTGIYFALTGESNININAPGVSIPATIAHEIAHQLGVFTEDEANFVAIIACIRSGNIVYEYSGLFLGLSHLLTALRDADYQAWLDVWDSFVPELRQDFRDAREFWDSQRTVDTGIGVLDTILNALNETVYDAVNTVYDGFLRVHNQELGLQSYGACVDLLIAYFLPPVA